MVVVMNPITVQIRYPRACPKSALFLERVSS
jgi:hypothetical protein